MQKKKSYKPFAAVAVLIMIIVMAQDLQPYTSIGFLKIIRTPFTLGFQKQTFQLYVGETLKLRVNRLNVRVRYRTSDYKLAYVSWNGKVTALRPGTVIIYGEIGDKTISCKIKILKKQN